MPGGDAGHAHPGTGVLPETAPSALDEQTDGCMPSFPTPGRQLIVDGYAKRVGHFVLPFSMFVREPRRLAKRRRHPVN